VKLALRGLLGLSVALVVTQAGVAAPARMRLVTSPESFVLWNVHDGLLGVGFSHNGGNYVSGAVERTTDGGRTYDVVLRTRDAVYSLRTVGRNGAIATSYDGRSWRTTDRGHTWQRAATHLAAFWRTSRLGVSFRSYFVGNQGRLALRVTHDGGRRWHRQPDPCKTGVSYSAAADLVTPKLWWVACLGQGGAGNEEKAIYRTRDGGKTWRVGAMALVSPRMQQHGGIGMYGYPDGISFAPNGFGLLWEDRGALYVTRDGGVHWRAVPAARPEIDFGGGGAAFGDGTGYVLLRLGAPRLIATHDFGRTWHVVRRWRA
jgi:photosystem II stability/assembly factor-like uncharacterized protein